MTMIIIFQAPEKSEPVLADKEIIMAALNIKTMSFGSDYLKVVIIVIIIIVIVIIVIMFIIIIVNHHNHNHHTPHRHHMIINI